MDVQKFSKELSVEVKSRFPALFPEDSELPSQAVALVTTIVAIALEKYERERNH